MHFDFAYRVERAHAVSYFQGHIQRQFRSTSTLNVPSFQPIRNRHQFLDLGVNPGTKSKPFNLHAAHRFLWLVGISLCDV
jgi:hypothetical protein